MRKKGLAKSILFGVAVGDAIGAPHEFKSRKDMRSSPASGPSGFGTWNQEPGTWTDDSSLTFCLAESLINGYNPKDISRRFVAWKSDGYWSARGEVFDVGVTTGSSIDKLELMLESGVIDFDRLAREADEFSNGNGSLMRILPLLIHLRSLTDSDEKTKFDLVAKTSALTHAHVRSIAACQIYLDFADALASGTDKYEAYEALREFEGGRLESLGIPETETNRFSRILSEDIMEIPESKIGSSGYVIDTLEAAVRCFLISEDYSDCVLKAVNLGGDTDTIASVAGGLAGIYYGYESIPEKWIASLARSEDIADLAERLERAYFAE